MNVFFDARAAIILVSTAGLTAISSNSEILLEQSSVRAERFMTIVTQRPPQNKLSAKLDGVVFDCSSICAVMGPLNAARDSEYPNNFLSSFASMVTWQDQNTVYKRGTTFLSFAFIRQPQQFIGNKLTDLNSWKSLFNAEMNGCVEASIATTILPTSSLPDHRFSDSSGTIPEPCGVKATELP